MGSCMVGVTSKTTISRKKNGSKVMRDSLKRDRNGDWALNEVKKTCIGANFSEDVELEKDV